MKFKLLVLAFLMLSHLMLWAKIKCIGQTDNGSICLIKENKNIYIENKKFAPATIHFYALISNNVVTSKPLPLNIVVPAKNKVLAFKFKKKDPKKPHQFGYKWTWVLGDMRRVPNMKYPNLLPFKKGEKYRVSQGPGGGFSHQGKVIDAVDFSMKVKTKIHAIRSGIVINSIEHFKEAGNDPSLKEKANLLAILQDDGSIARYAHLDFKGALVKVGDKVKAGDEIALSGFTGYARGPHLHLEVSRALSGREYTSVPIYFKTSQGLIRNLKKNISYVH